MPKGQRLTQGQIAEMQGYRVDGMAVADIAAKMHLSEKAVVSHTGPMKRLRSDSGRDRLLQAIAKSGPYETMEDLQRAAVPDVDYHSAMHLVYSLGRAGLVRFREVQNGTHKRLADITATARGRAIVGVTAPPVSVTREEPVVPQEAPDTSASVPGQEDATETVGEAVAARAVERAEYPRIEALVARSWQLTRAAQLLEQAGQDELALATIAKIEDVSPLEREVIALWALVLDRGLVS